MTPIAENLTPGFPDGWTGATASGAYRVGQTDAVHTGKSAAYLFGFSAPGSTGATFGQSFPADSLRGKRIRVSVWVKHDNVNSLASGLTVRVDGPGLTLALERTNLTGTDEWHQIAIVAVFRWA